MRVTMAGGESVSGSVLALDEQTHTLVLRLASAAAEGACALLLTAECGVCVGWSCWDRRRSIERASVDSDPSTHRSNRLIESIDRASRPTVFHRIISATSPPSTQPHDHTDGGAPPPGAGSGSGQGSHLRFLCVNAIQSVEVVKPEEGGGSSGNGEAAAQQDIRLVGWLDCLFVWRWWREPVVPSFDHHYPLSTQFLSPLFLHHSSTLKRQPPLIFKHPLVGPTPPATPTRPPPHTHTHV